MRGLGGVFMSDKHTYRTGFIAFANMAARSNTAHGITSQGFSDACEIPLAARDENSAVASRS